MFAGGAARVAFEFEVWRVLETLHNLKTWGGIFAEL